tara:strand:+ start:1534 stop:2007 length:474 start_codon:yes stop_codon:yes gene_type:complete
MNNNNFLIKALKSRRKVFAPNSNNNNNNNKFIKKPGKIFTLSNATKEANKRANKRANNTQQLFGLMGQEFLKMAANNSFAKNKTIEEQEKTINILLIKLKLAKGLLRQIKKRNNNKSNKELMLSKYNALMKQEHNANKVRTSQRVKKSTKKNNFKYY